MTTTLDHQTSKILLDISTQLHCKYDLDHILQNIVDVATDLTKSKGSSILLFEEETQQFYFAAVQADNPDNLTQVRVPIEQSVTGKVYKLSKKLLIADAKNHPLIFKAGEKLLQVSTRNLLAVPIIFDSKTLGTLEVFNKLDRQDFSQSDQEILEVLAGYAATAIQIQRGRDEAFRIAEERKELAQRKTDFIAIASHELRSPLGLILGHATFLQELLQDGIYQNQLNVIIRNAEKLKDIIDELSRVDNLENDTASIRWQMVDVVPLIQSVIHSYHNEADDREIPIITNFPAEQSQIYCDPAKMGVAIGNIIKNALVFSDDGKGIQISLEKLPGHIQIAIKDQGIGIPSEDLHRIFERFYQVEHHMTRSHGGMGLGLSVSKAIIESHRGQIWVDSTVGEGSTFTILLPSENLEI
jgi:signal transduction histidine kinase